MNDIRTYFSNTVTESSITEIHFNDKSKGGKLWQCIGRFVSSTSEEFYLLCHKNLNSKHMEEINNQIFPAIESDILISKTTNDIFNRLHSLGYFMNYSQTDEIDPILKFSSGCDFAENTFFLCLPGRKTLENRFEKLKLEKPDLLAFHLLHSNGIATDEDFIVAFLNGHIVLNENAEFVHDHTVHVAIQLDQMMNNSELYTKGRQRIKQRVSNFYELIKYLRTNKCIDAKYISLLMMGLSYFIDIYTSATRANEIHEIDDLDLLILEFLRDKFIVIFFFKEGMDYTQKQVNEYRFFMDHLNNEDFSIDDFDKQIKMIAQVAEADPAIESELRNIISRLCEVWSAN